MTGVCPACGHLLPHVHANRTLERVCVTDGKSTRNYIAALKPFRDPVDTSTPHEGRVMLNSEKCEIKTLFILEERERLWRQKPGIQIPVLRLPQHPHL